MSASSQLSWSKQTFELTASHGRLVPSSGHSNDLVPGH